MSRAKKKMGCGCDMGCGCKQELGQNGPGGGFSPLWFVAGAGAGVGLWYLLNNMWAGSGPGQTAAAPLPALTPPTRYGNLQAVAARLEQLKTLYKVGQVNSEQALGEAENLITAAYQFPEEGEAVNDVVMPILDFKAQIETYLESKRERVPAASNFRTMNA